MKHIYNYGRYLSYWWFYSCTKISYFPMFPTPCTLSHWLINPIVHFFFLSTYFPHNVAYAHPVGNLPVHTGVYVMWLDGYFLHGIRCLGKLLLMFWCRLQPTITIFLIGTIAIYFTLVIIIDGSLGGINSHIEVLCKNYGCHENDRHSLKFKSKDYCVQYLWLVSIKATNSDNING